MYQHNKGVRASDDKSRFSNQDINKSVSKSGLSGDNSNTSGFGGSN
jgi:hypothetical protein